MIPELESTSQFPKIPNILVVLCSYVKKVTLSILVGVESASSLKLETLDLTFCMVGVESMLTASAVMNLN